MLVEFIGARALVRAAAAGVALGAAVSVAAPVYRVAEVPEQAGALPVAVGLSDEGVVVGDMHVAGESPRVFRWRAGPMLEFAPRDDPKFVQHAVSIDRRGAVAYTVSWPGQGFPGKFLRTEVWGARSTPAKKLRGLYTYFGNAAGDLIADGGQATYALRMRDGTLIDIPAPAGTQLFDLNDRQQVVGVSNGRPFGWSPAAGADSFAAVQGQPAVAAVAINDRGDVALMSGPLELARDDPDNAPNTLYFRPAGADVRAIEPIPACAWYRPRRLGPGGTMVGHCFAEPSPLSREHAFAWDAASGVYLLADQIDPLDPLAGAYDLTKAVAINRSGQILVQAWHRTDGRPRLLVLTPMP